MTAWGTIPVMRSYSLAFCWIPALALLAVACERDPEETGEPAVFEVLELTCVDGHTLSQMHRSASGALFGTAQGYPSLGDTVMRSVDDGRTWDRVPLLAEPGLQVVEDLALLEGWRLDRNDGGPYLLFPDGHLEARAWRGREAEALPGTAQVLPLDADRLLARLESGWLRLSTDGGQRFVGLKHGVMEGVPGSGTFAGDRAIRRDDDWPGEARYTQDGGASWAPIAIGLDARAALFGEAGIAQMIPGELLLSLDHGQSWRPHLISDQAWVMGPGESEIWIVDRSGPDRSEALRHTEDGGLTWTTVVPESGGAPLAAADLRWVVDDAAGEGQIFGFHLPADRGFGLGTLRCHTGGDGSLRSVVSPGRVDDRDTITFWAKDGWVPMPVPGARGVLSPPIAPPSDYLRDPVALERTPEGDLIGLFVPERAIDPEQGPPMLAIRVAGTDGSAVVSTTSFSNLRESTSLTAGTRYLEANGFQRLPGGELRARTSEGDFPFGGAWAVHVPFPGPGSLGRWGTIGADLRYVLAGSRFPVGQPFRRYESAHDVVDCFPMDGSPPSEACINGFTDGPVMDHALFEGRIFVLDALHGRLLAHSYSGGETAWTPVVEGLQHPTALYNSLDPSDPGLYVYDTAWWRVVPGFGNPIRRP